MKSMLMLFALFVLLGCAATRTASVHPPARPELLNEHTFKIPHTSTDKTYGFTPDNPIRVGGATQQEGPLNERRFLNALAGPNGEAIRYVRTGSCCHFKTKNGLMGTGLLDRYKIEWDGIQEPVYLYLNMYDAGELSVPVGFTLYPAGAQNR